jgi:hypothetical protein
VKSNKEQTDQEFAYTYALKRMAHKMEYIQLELNAAKSVGMQGDSAGALTAVEGRIYDLKASIYNALKTV